MASVAVEARDLSKQFILRHNRGASIKTKLLGVLHERQRERLEPFWALRDISLSIGRGEQVGLVGRNGSGKSTLMKLVAGIHRPTSGHLLIARNATIGTMIELGVGFHPDLTGTENVFLNASIHGRSRAEIEAIYPAIVDYSGLDRFMDVALKNYSSGMHMRLGFAVAANLNPDILLLDEVFAVGDEDFQNKCMKTMAQFAADGRTIVFVSHSVMAVRSMCRRVCVLDAGRLLFDGHVERGLATYQKLLQGSLGAPAPDGQPAAVEQPTEDVTDLARRLLGEWTFEWLKREGLQPHHRVVEIGIQPVIGSPCPILEYVGASNYAYWQAGRPAPAALTSADYVVAGSVFLHFPLNVIARMVAMAQRDLPAGARFYATFFEAPGMQTFVPTQWPGGFVTSADSVPYQYSLDLLTGIAEAFGATVHRVGGVTHPNGESGLVIVK